MHQIDTQGAVPNMPDMQAGGEPGWFHEGGAGKRPTKVGADWFNMIQAELLNALAAAGVKPDKSKLNQLTQAIRALGGESTQAALEAHQADPNAHAQYATTEAAAQLIAKAVSTHNTDPAAHPGMATEAQVSQAVSAGISAHLQTADPHSQYVSEQKAAQVAAAAVTAHAQQVDPHPDYLTNDEAASVARAAITEHTQEVNPHQQYVRQEDLGSAVADAAAAAMTQHEQATLAHDADKLALTPGDSGLPRNLGEAIRQLASQIPGTPPSGGLNWRSEEVFLFQSSLGVGNSIILDLPTPGDIVGIVMSANPGSGSFKYANGLFLWPQDASGNNLTDSISFAVLNREFTVLVPINTAKLRVMNSMSSIDTISVAINRIFRG
ncbi:hypothetical protein [Shewanella algae]|uniref:hypothetical protein n=1 Tax=Shewanella algae TaxID=38313 RepID=UPI0031F4C66E